MLRNRYLKATLSLLLFINPILAFSAENVSTPQYKNLDAADPEKIPVLIKHLPNWENMLDRAVLARDSAPLKAALGSRAILDQIDFSAGTEAVTAPYDNGKLLIIEYGSPQASTEEDAKFIAKLAENGESGSTIYRRIGNYSVFVFDAPSESAGRALLEQVKYEKTITWLGKDPNILQRAERAFVVSTTNLFVSTVLVIAMGIGFSIAAGILVGFIYFRIRERQRAGMSAYSDAGGMVRLNLDGFTNDIVPQRFLKD